MKHQIFNQIQKVKAAASKLEGAKALNFSPDFQGEKRLVLNVEVKRLRATIKEAQLQHSEMFQIVEDTKVKAIDLMEMGY